MSENVLHEAKIGISEDMTDHQLQGMMKVTTDIIAERARQHEKWGEQNWPDFYDVPPIDRCNTYWIPEEGEAKERVESAARRGALTYGDILIEELAEAFSAPNKAELRKELIQVAAVAQAWIEKLDREGVA